MTTTAEAAKESADATKPRGERLCNQIGVSEEHSENMEKI